MRRPATPAPTAPAVRWQHDAWEPDTVPRSTEGGSVPPLNQPMPPLDTTVMPHAAETMFTFVTGIPMVIVFGIGVLQLVRGRGPLLLLCFVGGLLAASAEPVVDMLSGLYFPHIGQ